MPVGISNILHVLAHELRTPVGIAHGYVRLLLEDRLPREPERRRALEQMQKALSRLTALSHESTALASWYEQDAAEGALVSARSVLDRVEDADYEWPVTIDSSRVDESAMLRTSDGAGLAHAIVNLVRATARELRGAECIVSARVDEEDRLEVLSGPPSEISIMSAGPDAPGAGPFALERGGLGLTLVHAAIVLDAHGAERWTMNGSRHIAGIRLPLAERSER